jgi:hypothetical protein
MSYLPTAAFFTDSITLPVSADKLLPLDPAISALALATVGFTFTLNDVLDCHERH